MTNKINEVPLNSKDKDNSFIKYDYDKDIIKEHQLDSSKKTILVIHRDRLTPFFTETVESLKFKFNVVVLSNSEKGLEAYKDISGITLIRHIDYRNPDPAYAMVEDLTETIKEIEDELGFNCYEFNKNYFLYSRFTTQYHVIKPHAFLNDHVPELLVANYFKIKHVVAKYNVKYALYETTDLLDSAILSAMAFKGIITQTFERGFFSLGGDIRFRVASGRQKRSLRLNYIYKNKLFSKESLQWAKQVLDQNSEKRVISNYDKVHMKMTSFFSMYTPMDILKKLSRVVFKKEPIIPAVCKQKNRLLSKKYFSNQLPDEKIITYFLQMTPEASMCSEAPKYADQSYLLEQIAIYGKYGYTLAVKEHPRSFGNRKPDFYYHLSSLPNVVILAPDFSNRELIERSEAVISVTGTTPSIEALTSGCPVITLGRPYFDICKNVFHADSPEEVWSIVGQIHYSTDDQIEFLAALYESSYPHPEATHIQELVEAKGIGPTMAEAIEAEITLYEAGKLKHEGLK
ncbi:hypothetical protein [Maridesulfovibrio bastinii]|uniref:capsular polysaccharide export protein, LipB/KpsS family n=1 Tax=Maridesulfovibrio bastinii TaxID=47157 RepID=UPI0003F5EFC2|nr:hypothetical protein [Maridesulfovibrio bastinii]